MNEISLSNLHDTNKLELWGYTLNPKENMTTDSILLDMVKPASPE